MENYRARNGELQGTKWRTRGHEMENYMARNGELQGTKWRTRGHEMEDQRARNGELEGTKWRTRFGRCFGPAAIQIKQKTDILSYDMFHVTCINQKHDMY